MFTGLIDGARALRVQLVAGYSAILTGYIMLNERHFADSTKWTGGVAALNNLYESFGPAGRAAFWAFVAFVVGSILCNAGFTNLVDWVAKWPKGPDWKKFIEDAQTKVRTYEEYKVAHAVPPAHSGLGSVLSGNNWYQVPSPHHAAQLQSEVDDRVRRHAEVQFRVALLLGLVPPVLAMFLRYGWIWLLLLVPGAFIWWDSGRMQDRTRLYMNTAKRDVLESELAMVEAELFGLRKKLEKQEASVLAADVDKKSKAMSDLTSGIATLGKTTARLHAELDVLNRERDELFKLSRLRTRTKVAALPPSGNP